MKEVVLHDGHIALVDDEDFDLINAFRWHVIRKGGVLYAQRYERKCECGNRKRRRLKMHHIVMGHPGQLVIDHINHNGLDNRKENLRIVTRRENHMNPLRQNKTGFIGVTKSYHKYNVSIRIDGKKKFIGSFDTPELAHIAYMNCANGLINREVN